MSSDPSPPASHEAPRESSSSDTAREPSSSDTASAEATSPVAPTWEPLDADGRERPKFLQHFPPDPELQRLARAFEVGNFRLVREAAPALAASTADERVRSCALELERRIAPDPTVVYLLCLALGTLAFLVGWTYLGH